MLEIEKMLRVMEAQVSERESLRLYVLLDAATPYSYQLQQKLTHAVMPLSSFYRRRMSIPLFCALDGGKKLAQTHASVEWIG